ncbi:MAG: 4-hydroxy-tetrahydrodipicolinate synthase [Bacteroidales bacterium]
MNTQLTGLGVALITPFDREGKIDFTALESLVHFVSNNGANYLVVLGTTAETATLTTAEKTAIIHHIHQCNTHKLPIVLGLGGNNTSDMLATIAKTDFTHISALMSVTPYYNKPSQQGLYAHYKEIAMSLSLPLILYNVPGRTGINLAASTTLRLAHNFSNIIAVKEASANLSQVGYILRDKPKDFLVISGDDAMALPMISMGAKGLISVAANIIPQQISQLAQYALGEENHKSAEIHLKLLPFIDALFEEGNPAGVKAALSVIGMIKNELRLPLVPVSSVLFEKIESLLPSK